MYCKFCGKEIMPEDNYCKHCGKQLNSESQSSSPTSSNSKESNGGKLALGIVGIVFSFTIIVSLSTSIPGLVLSINKKYTTGIIVNVVALGLATLFFISNFIVRYG